VLATPRSWSSTRPRSTATTSPRRASPSTARCWPTAARRARSRISTPAPRCGATAPSTSVATTPYSRCSTTTSGITSRPAGPSRLTPRAAVLATPRSSSSTRPSSTATASPRRASPSMASCSPTAAGRARSRISTPAPRCGATAPSTSLATTPYSRCSTTTSGITSRPAGPSRLTPRAAVLATPGAGAQPDHDRRQPPRHGELHHRRHAAGRRRQAEHDREFRHRRHVAERRHHPRQWQQHRTHAVRRQPQGLRHGRRDHPG